MAVAGTGYMNSVQDSAQPSILNTMNKLIKYVNVHEKGVLL